MASGNTLNSFFPADNEPPSTNFATIGVRNGHPKLEFDDTTQETAIFTGIMPRHYSGGGVTVAIHAIMASAVSGSVSWDLAFERMSDGATALNSDSFAATQNVAAVTVPATAGIVFVCSASVSNGANIDGIAVGDSFRLRLRRVIGGGAVGDVELIAVEMRET